MFNFFSTEESAAFLQALDQYFRSIHVKYELRDGVLEMPNKDFGFVQSGLLNVAQSCKQHNIKDYLKVITGHFESIKKQQAFEKEFNEIVGTFDKVKHYVAARLYNQEYVSSLPAKFTITRPIAGDVVAVLVFDLPHAISNITPEQAAAWNIPLAELFEMGLNNVKKNYTTQLNQEELGGLKIWFASGDHFFVGNIALDLHERPELVGNYGTLVGVPHRHGALIYPIESLEVIQAINTFMPVIHGMYQEGPGSISDNILWYSWEGLFTNLPYRIEKESKNMAFTPPEAFVSMLNELTE